MATLRWRRSSFPAPYRDPTSSRPLSTASAFGLGILCLGSVAHFLGMLATRLGRFDDAEACFEEALAAEELRGARLCAYTRYEQAVLYLTWRVPGRGTQR